MSNRIIDHKFREILLPTILIAMALNISSIVDATFVANFIGYNGQAALQVFEPIVLLITIFEWLFGLGGQILALNQKAEFNEDGSNHYYSVALLTTTVISVVLMILFFAFENTLIAVLRPNHEIIPLFIAYAKYAFISFPLATVLTVLCQFIRVDGQPNLSSALIIIANVVNIILDFIFMGYLHMGIEGASLATVIGYTLGLLGVLKYYFDSKRTFKFTLSGLRLSSWIKSTVEIMKIGFPGASVGLFDVIVVYILNIVISSVMGTIGLDIYNVCVNALLVISILIIGFSETLSSIVPIYYSQNDFNNLNHIVRKSIIWTLIGSIAFTVFLWIYPDGFLVFYNLHNMPNDSVIENALRFFSTSFIPYAFISILIFYYEGIERFVPAGLLSIIYVLIGPLLFTFTLYPLIGANGIWLSFLFGSILALLAAFIYSKFVESREKEYHGLFYIKKDLIPKTRNYILENINDSSKIEMFNHINDLNVDNSACEKLDEILKYIFENNEESILVEILIVDYDNHITVNIKDEGKREIMKNNAIFSKGEDIKSSEVLGFNNLELTIPKID